MSQRLEVVILAAGLGKRMKSDTIKVLHLACGRPLVDYVLDLAESLTNEKPILIVGHQRERVMEACSARARCVVQSEQLGTGHALLQAATEIESRGTKDTTILVLSGDVPLTRRETLERLLREHESTGSAATVLTMRIADPANYGRIVRAADGSLQKIVEAKDASAEQLAISEVNAGVYVFDASLLFEHLKNLGSDNAQGEYYLTDVIDVLRRDGKRVSAMAGDAIEALGVNSRADLAAVERELTRRTIARLMDEGVTFRNPDAVSIDASVRIGADTIVYPFVVIEGLTTIGRNCVVGPGVHLKNTKIADGVALRTGTVAEDATIAEGASVGPYAHLRPGSELGRKVKVGNFVETKKARFGEGAKASHLSYIGDAEIGADVNIGAGTITCNYDGVHKHKTVLEDGVFIGSDTQLVAPVRVGQGAYVGAGSTVTKDVPAGSLALSRTPQRNVEGWAIKRRQQQKKDSEKK